MPQRNTALAFAFDNAKSTAGLKTEARELRSDIHDIGQQLAGNPHKSVIWQKRAKRAMTTKKQQLAQVTDVLDVRIAEDTITREKDAERRFMVAAKRELSEPDYARIVRIAKQL